MKRHLATSRESLPLPSFTCACFEFNHIDILSTGQTSLCVNTIRGHRKALFQLNSRIRLIRFSSELSVHCAWKASRSISSPSIVTKRESTRHREASSSFRAAQIIGQGPLHPQLRANPFPEVTDLACRLRYLLYSVDQRLLTLETRCGSGYDQGCK